MSQQQRVTDRRRQLIGYSQRLIRDESSRPRREKTTTKKTTQTFSLSVCAKTRRIKETAETADVWVQHVWSDRTRTWKIQVSKAPFGFYCISPAFFLLSADSHCSSSWFPHVHCDFSEQIKLVYFHHFVGQRVDPVFVHRLSGVSDPVEPERKTHKEEQTGGRVILPAGEALSTLITTIYTG